MLKHLAATLVYASTLVLLIGVFHYDSPVGSNFEKAQNAGKYSCPKGQRFQSGRGCVPW